MSDGATEAPVRTSYRDLRMVGVTPRQIDVWSRNGWLLAEDPSPGSGYDRQWPAEELEVARLMVELIQVGLTPRAAHHAARNDGLLPGGTWQIKETTA